MFICVNCQIYIKSSLLKLGGDFFPTTFDVFCVIVISFLKSQFYKTFLEEI